MFTSRDFGCSTAWRRVFHAIDNLGASAGSGGASADILEKLNGWEPLIPSFWCFIHSLFGAKIVGLKRAIITGGTGGLGSAIARKLKEEEWEVLALGSDDLNLTDPGAVGDFFRRNPCELLICVAGLVRDEIIFRMSERSWDEVFCINYTAARLTAFAALQRMMERGTGHIVFISSHAAIHPAPGQAAYASAKAALLGLTKDLAGEYGSSGIRINAVLPGFLETPMTQGIEGSRREEVLKAHALGKFNTTAAVAGFIWFLHEHLPFTSGQVFQLDSRP